MIFHCVVLCSVCIPTLMDDHGEQCTSMTRATNRSHTSSMFVKVC